MQLAPDYKTAEEKLQKAKESADEANRAKSSFLANMSHELRSPLNAILGFAQLLLRSHTLTPEQQENVTTINRSGEHLLNLINQVLDLSKIEAGRIVLNETDFDLKRLLDELEDMFQLKADNKRLKLLFDRKPDVPQYIRSDQIKLRQVLINLLNNALKFTREGTVSLRIDSDSHIIPGMNNSRQRIIHFEIEDTGCGIASEDIDNIFKAFVQTKDGMNVQDGTGLGLPISRKFVQMMGGQITVKSEIGSGTTFIFDIHVTEVDGSIMKNQQSTSRVTALAPDQPTYRILVVDDKTVNRQLLIKLFQPLGFEIKEAESGEEGIKIWEEWQPHLIWMDIRMPGMNGREAIQKIKSSDKGKNTVIIALTASVLEEERVRVMSAGCDDFLRKPFKEEDIFHLMAKHIGVRFIYEGANAEKPEISGPKAQDNTVSALRELPNEWINELQQGLVQADPDLINPVMEQIQAKNPNLSDTLNQYLQDFNYDTILKLLETANQS